MPLYRLNNSFTNFRLGLNNPNGPVPGANEFVDTEITPNIFVDTEITPNEFTDTQV